MQQEKIEIFAAVKKIISEKLNTKPQDVTLDAYLQDDLGADGLDLVEFVLHLEENFGLPIDEDQAEALQTVGDVVDFIFKTQKRG